MYIHPDPKIRHLQGLANSTQTWMGFFRRYGDARSATNAALAIGKVGGYIMHVEATDQESIAIIGDVSDMIKAFWEEINQHQFK